MDASNYVTTSISRRLIARMQATHDQRRIAVFSGPPSIGKTTAISQFRSENPDAIGVIKIGRKNARDILTLKYMLNTIRSLSSSNLEYVPTSIWELRKSVFVAIAEWAGSNPRTALRAKCDYSMTPPLTIIFDEAQNLSRQAIESLRYWNDRDLCYSPFPLGLIFVGNNEFSLAPTASGESPISEAVADRALFIEKLSYDEITDDDLIMVLRTMEKLDRDAASIVLRAFKDHQIPRSIRRLTVFLGDLKAVGNGKIETADDILEAMKFV